MTLSIDGILDGINKFYSSDRYADRYLKRLDRLGISVSLLGQAVDSTLEITRDARFVTYDEDSLHNAFSTGNTIGLNRNVDPWETNPWHFHNLVMHEVGHIQYGKREFRQVRELNGLLPGNPLPVTEGNDLEYFMDRNEIRQRIMPLVWEAWMNNWTYGETLELTREREDLIDIYPREQMLEWMENML